MPSVARRVVLLAFLAVIASRPAEAANPAVSNCTNSTYTLCFYNHDDIVQASPASAAAWKPGEVKAGTCRGSPCKIKVFPGSVGCGTGAGEPNFDTAADDSYFLTSGGLVQASDDPNYFGRAGVGKCGMTPLGGQCKYSQDCRDGNSCADGVCCNSACSASCQACNVPGHVGYCTGVAEHGSDAECQGDLVWCEGGGCVIKPQPNGHTCTQANQCASNFCSNHYCRAPNGTPCTSRNECQSDACVDGYCCDGACGGACQACNVPGSLGQCKPVPFGTNDSTCAAPLACNGSGSCRARPGATCGANTDCLAGVCSPQSSGAAVCCNQTCSGPCVSCSLPTSAGVCQRLPYGSQGGCGPLMACNQSAQCVGAQGATCTAAAQCLSGGCLNGRCRGLLKGGQRCLSTLDCQTGQCNKGICSTKITGTF